LGRAVVGLIAHAQGLAGLPHGLALAEQNLGFTEFADNLFWGVSSSWHLTLLPYLTLTLHLDQFWGGRSQSPVFQMVPAREKFENPTRQVHELWQTDFTQFKVFNHWGLI